jgi:Leu/Phe-tRNA-protein transferase
MPVLVRFYFSNIPIAIARVFTFQTVFIIKKKISNIALAPQQARLYLCSQKLIDVQQNIDLNPNPKEKTFR